MNKSIAIGSSVILVLAVVIPGYFIFVNLDNNRSLTIYTYDSLLADPGFEFDRAFEKFAGLENGSVKVVYFSDAASVLNRAITEKDSPIADILIGIDNVLVNKARANDILEPYRPIEHLNIISSLVDGLASDYLLTPYDYGVISLWYINERLEGTLDPDNLILTDLIDSTIARQIIVEDPALSSPGLGFLLHTISIFGDAETGIKGVVDGDWRQFWSDLSDEDIRIVPSWGTAIDLLYTKEEGRPVMVSYTSSPAYSSCLFDDRSTTSVLSHEMGTTWGWRQIEGIGLVKESENKDLGKQFIDWFISNELQSEIYQNQWVYPAIKNITPPSCYDSVIPFDSITPLNDFIPQSILAENLDSWLDDWEQAVT
ncbi:MAG: Thiamine-binding periplasmic protein precursor [Candidatus Heimdallarchaeota archaeon LC_2]|nr:MAG: Thiamine-binding periplasmic protein precursor [Candidatus Heimdallarchaeota archaeon LC_2]